MRTAFAPLCALALATCNPTADSATDDPTDSTTASTSSSTTTSTPNPFDPTEAPHDNTDPVPQQTPWTLVIDALPFPATITSLTVGGAEYIENYANRGKVEVLFDHDTLDISVEMRLYDFTSDDVFYGDAENRGTIDRIHLWAYATTDDPKPPAAMPPEFDCTVDTWKDGCQLRSYHDGKAQPARSGADFRVHLPRSWRGELIVITEDNSAEPSYPRLGDLKIDGLCSSGRVTLDQGYAAIKLCRDLSPAPTCPSDQVTACENFADPMGTAAAWAPDCPCPPALYGRLLISTPAERAADITIDIPDTTWLNAHLTNDEPTLPHACHPVIAGCPSATCSLGSTTYSADAEFNLPGPAAAPGGGYNLTARSSACHNVEYVAGPDAWHPDTTILPSIEHGHIRVCTDCL